MLKKDDASTPLTEQGKTATASRCPGLCGEYGIFTSNRRRALFIFGIVLIVAAVVLSVELTKKNDDNNAVIPEPIWVTQSRLSSNVVPHHYHLNYLVNLTSFHFNGQLGIELDIQNDTDLIILHAGNDMSIQDVMVSGGPNATFYPPASFFTYARNEFLIVSMNTSLFAGSYVLNITFDQKLINGTYGFYHSSYKTLAGETRYLATTQFEPTSARDAFPCFDEPAFKANFSITITCEPQYHALANMPIKNQTNTTTTRTFEFETSVKMSTYLVAMVVSDFESVSAYTTSRFGPTLVSIWTHHDQINQTAIALNASVTQLSYFEDLFNFAYPLPKQDFIAIPDYSGGAMENWGLITFEEVSLLFDPLESSQANAQRVVSVIAHELAHQWFGDLVTMQWWSDTYLNEGFAQYFEYAGTTAVYPDWDMFSQFTIIAQQEAQTIDAMTNSHPVIMEGLTTKGIGGMFDDITYDKGASLNRMMAGFLGDGWLRGLKNYLSQHAYGNTLAPDLFSALSAVSSPQLDVGTIMSTWTLQTGYPVLTVTQVDGGLQVTQNRFFSSPGQTSDTKWHIYVTSLVPSNTTVQSTWFQPTHDSIFIPYNSTVDPFIKLDVNETGLYRVNYPISLWNSLTEALINQTNSILSVSDRTGLLSDVAALAEADLVPYSLALNVTRFLATEHSYVVWKMARDMLDLIGDRLLTTSIYTNWINYMQNLLVLPYQKIGWNNTNNSGLDKLHRTLILDLACEYSVSDCRQQATTQFQQFYANNVTTTIDPNIRDVVYRWAIANDTTGLYFDYLYNRYQNVTITPAEQQRILYALTATKIPTKLQQLLRDALNVKNIRTSRDALNVIEWIAQSGEGTLVWTYITDPNNWSILSTRYQSDSSFGNLIRRTTALFATSEQKQQVQQFLDQRASTLGANSIRSASLALETIQANIDWLSNNENEIANYLKIWNF